MLGSSTTCDARLLRRTSKHARCIANESYSCFNERTVLLKHGCEGKFQCGTVACDTVTEHQLIGTEFHRSYPTLWRARAAVAPALVLGAMLDLSSSPYVTNGAVRDAREPALTYSLRMVLKAIERFMAAAATQKLVADGLLSVHVVHELPDAPEQHKGVWLHKLERPIKASGRPIPAHDARWEAYLQVLATMPTHQRPHASSCAFSVDFSDVRVLNDLRLLCDAHPPDALFASSDLCHGAPPARLLMLKQMRETGYKPSHKLRHFLTRKSNVV